MPVNGSPLTLGSLIRCRDHNEGISRPLTALSKQSQLLLIYRSTMPASCLVASGGAGPMWSSEDALMLAAHNGFSMEKLRVSEQLRWLVFFAYADVGHDRDESMSKSATDISSLCRVSGSLYCRLLRD
jgi:hypothetical protein